MPKKRSYEKSHPWITFAVDLRRLPSTFWTQLGEVQSKCRHVAQTLLPPDVAQELYEIYLASVAPVKDDGIDRARAEDIERLFDIMRNALLKIGFLDSENPEHMLLAFRRIFGRAGLEEKDVRILTGMFRQIEWYANQGWQIVEEKEKKGIKIR